MPERIRVLLVVAAMTLGGLSAPAAAAAAEVEAGDVVATNHYVRHRSSIPVIAGQPVQLYVREKVSSTAEPSRGAVLFVHGGTYPTETAFDLPYRDYSWMDDLAEAGFHVFSVDMEGYGKSSRPWPMDDPCNLSAANQAILIPDLLSAPCAPSYPYALTTNASDRDALDTVVDWTRERADVDRVNLVGWSQGGTRTGGYASDHPDKVDRLVLVAPAYNRSSADAAPRPQPAGVPFAIQTQAGFTTRWDQQVTCEDQVDPAARSAMWEENMAFDPVGATWGPGVVRRPINAGGGWNEAAAARVTAPTLILEGAGDIEVTPAQARSLYDDLGSRRKVFALVECASHFATVETQYGTLQGLARTWLLQGRAAGQRRGLVTVAHR